MVEINPAKLTAQSHHVTLDIEGRALSGSRCRYFRTISLFVSNANHEILSRGEARRLISIFMWTRTRQLITATPAKIENAMSGKLRTMIFFSLAVKQKYTGKVFHAGLVSAKRI